MGSPHILRREVMCPFSLGPRTAAARPRSASEGSGVGGSDGAAAGEAAVGAVVPDDVGVALEPAPQHGPPVALAREVQQDRGVPLQVYAARADPFDGAVEAGLQRLGLRDAAERAVFVGRQV